LPYACTGSMESYGVQGMSNSVFMWEIAGGAIVDGQNSDTVVIQWDYRRGDHRISVTEFTEFGCAGIPVEAEVELNAPVADLGSDVEACAGEVYTFDATTNYLTEITYLWPDNSSGTDFSTSADGYVWVQITGTDGCADFDSAYLTTNPLPVVNLGNDTAICGTATLVIDAGIFSSYLWSTSDIINPLTVDGHRLESEQVWVQVTDENGCVGSDTLMLEVCDVYAVFANIPNTITPGDKNDQNDKWVIPNIELFPDAELEIYDRWGRLIFKTDDIFNNPWDGESMSGKEMPMDAYYYVLDIKVANTKPLTGYINLVR